MSYTKSIYAGQKEDQAVESLVKALESRDGKSLYQHVSIHCMLLAMVLDRLEYLEKYKREVDAFFRNN